MDQRAAVLEFMGSMFGQAKAMDSMVVEGKNTRISGDFARTFEQHLRGVQQGGYIPPTPAEIQSAGVGPRPQAFIPEPVGDVTEYGPPPVVLDIDPYHAPYNPPTQQYGMTEYEQKMIALSVELLKRFDILIEKLGKPSRKNNVKQTERKKRKPRTIPGSDPESQ